MQKRKCPFFSSGFCNSPMLENPTDSVTNSIRCLDKYESCRYYVKGQEKKGLEEYEVEEIAQEVTFYKEANLLSEAIDSACENYVLNKLEDGFIASCKSMGRTLTRSQAFLCRSYWERCPFRK
ncbi:hypothetical protein [Sulfuracidifex metallicus]|uniref:hypothetical protein n=1 Tax=Sulfuracidifex metallicus TaxID=47303 RepID=UPI0022733D3E|nr:hypothetical protein [Sulfuracidifex metallicus]MCY0849558.1 hypothetical protein [Sulfuracidifex metallicus]